MAQFYPWAEGDGQGVYLERLVFGTAMAASIVLGIRRGATHHVHPGILNAPILVE